VLPDLKLSHKKLSFEFSHDSIKMYTTNVLTLTNESNSTVHFEFATRFRKTVFSVVQKKGFIKSGKSEDIVIRY